MERKQHIPVFIGCAVLLLLLLTVVFVLFFSPKDVSANHSGSQRLFGATYTTMNNPYYQELDALLRSNIEAMTCAASACFLVLLIPVSKKRERLSTRVTIYSL